MSTEVGEVQFALAMRNGLTTDAIRHTTFCYPTAASDIEYMLP